MKLAKSVRAKNQDAKSDGVITSAGLTSPWAKNIKTANGLMKASEVLEHSGIDFEVVKEPIQTVSGHAISDKFAIRRTDTNDVLGVVGNQYEAYRNRRAMQDFDAILQESQGMFYDGAGAFGKGERCYIQAAVSGDIGIRNSNGTMSDDTVRRYLLCSNSFDGSSPVVWCSTLVRVICFNTLVAAIKTADEMFKMRHTKNGLGDIVPDVRSALGIVNKSYEELEAKINALVKKPMTDNQFEEYIGKLGFKTESENKRAKNLVKDMKDLFGGAGKGSTFETAKGTAWGGLNAVTEYIDWHRTTRLTKNASFKSEDEARLASQWFGSGMVLKEKALELALVA